MISDIFIDNSLDRKNRFTIDHLTLLSNELCYSWTMAGLKPRHPWRFRLCLSRYVLYREICQRLFHIQLSRQRSRDIENQGVTYIQQSRSCPVMNTRLQSGYFLGGLLSKPASSPITLTSEVPDGTTTFALLVRDCSTACNRRSNCAFPLKYRSAASLTSLMA